MSLDKRVPYRDSRTKYAVAFFRMFGSSVTLANSRFNRSISAACSDVSLRAFTGKNSRKCRSYILARMRACQGVGLAPSCFPCGNSFWLDVNLRCGIVNVKTRPLPCPNKYVRDDRQGNLLSRRYSSNLVQYDCNARLFISITIACATLAIHLRQADTPLPLFLPQSMDKAPFP